MESPNSSSDGERSPKRRRVSIPSIRGGDASHIYANNDLPFSSIRPTGQAYDVHSTPHISITRGSDSDASTPRPPLPSLLDGTSEDADMDDTHDTLMPMVDTPRSSQMDSEDEYPGSRFSPIPPEMPHESAPELRYKPKLILRGHKRGVSCVKFSPDGKWIASCCKFLSTFT